MNRTEYLLTQLSSECMEVAHRVTKALQFGLFEVQPGQEFNNEQRLIQEYTDLLGTMDLLSEAGILVSEIKAENIIAKKKKVAKYMEYAKSKGTLK